MKKTAKKVLILVLAAVFCFSLAGCANNTKPSGETDNSAGGKSPGNQENTKGEEKKPVEITFSVMNSTNELHGWTAMVEAANKKLAAEGSNVSIKIVKEAAADWPEYYQKIVTQMAAGKAPDIARIANSFMPTVVNKGQAVDITSYVEKDLNLEDYFEESLKGANYVDGKYYGLPSGIYYMLMYYNKDLFDAAGLPYPSTDWNSSITFDKTEETAKALTVGSGATKQFGFSAGPYMAYM